MSACFRCCPGPVPSALTSSALSGGLWRLLAADPPTPAGLRPPPSPGSKAAVVPRRELRGVQAGGCLRPPSVQACPPRDPAGRVETQATALCTQSLSCPPAQVSQPRGCSPRCPHLLKGLSTFLSALFPCPVLSRKCFHFFFLDGEMTFYQGLCV